MSAADLTGTEIVSLFAGAGFPDLAFTLESKPGFVAGMNLEDAPAYGESPALDAVTDSLGAEAFTYELLFTGKRVEGE